MGNEYEEGNPVEYPAAFDGVLGVGAKRTIESLMPGALEYIEEAPTRKLIG